MTVRACSRCGAPLDRQPGMTMLRCQFCGAENDIGAPPSPLAHFPADPYRPAPPIQTDESQAQRVGAIVGVVIAIVTVAIVLPLVAFSSRSTTTTTTVRARPTATVAPIPTTPAETHFALADIHDIQLGFAQDAKVDAPGRSGTATAFEPIANWDWMLSIAHAWWDDALPFELSADPLATDGTADISGPSPSTYMTFVSKKCRAAIQKRAETAATSHDSSCTLRVQPHADWVELSIESIAADFNSATAARPITKPPCTFGQALAALSAQKRLTVRPRYAIRYENYFVGNPFRVSNGKDTASMNGVSISPSFCKSK